MRPWPWLLACASAAQKDPAAKSTTGTGTGHVYCADTNAPARLAHVQLETMKDAEERSFDHPGLSSMPVGGVVQTTFDGSFTIANVPPGSYYVVVNASGYLSPRVYDEAFDDAEPQPPTGQPPLAIPKVRHGSK